MEQSRTTLHSSEDGIPHLSLKKREPVTEFFRLVVFFVAFPIFLFGYSTGILVGILFSLGNVFYESAKNGFTAFFKSLCHIRDYGREE